MKSNHNKDNEDNEDNKLKNMRINYLKLNGLLNLMICPISLDVMRNPVIIAESGMTYDKKSLENYIENNKKENKSTLEDPITKKKFKYCNIIENKYLKNMIEGIISILLNEMMSKKNCKLNEKNLEDIDLMISFSIEEFDGIKIDPKKINLDIMKNLCKMEDEKYFEFGLKLFKIIYDSVGSEFLVENENLIKEILLNKNLILYYQKGKKWLKINKLQNLDGMSLFLIKNCLKLIKNEIENEDVLEEFINNLSEEETDLFFDNIIDKKYFLSMNNSCLREIYKKCSFKNVDYNNFKYFSKNIIKKVNNNKANKFTGEDLKLILVVYEKIVEIEEEKIIKEEDFRINFDKFLKLFENYDYYGYETDNENAKILSSHINEIIKIIKYNCVLLKSELMDKLFQEKKCFKLLEEHVKIIQEVIHEEIKKNDNNEVKIINILIEKLLNVINGITKTKIASDHFVIFMNLIKKYDNEEKNYQIIFDNIIRISSTRKYEMQLSTIISILTKIYDDEDKGNKIKISEYLINLEKIKNNSINVKNRINILKNKISQYYFEKDISKRQNFI